MRISANAIKKLYAWIYIWPAMLMYPLTPKRHRENLKMDMRRIVGDRVDKNLCLALYELLVAGGEFRNIYYMRIGQLSKLIKWYLKGQTLCGLNTLRQYVGGGIYIQHGWSMVLDAESVGENLWINQLVTVGFKGDGHPRIGNNVRIGTGAVILGKITIGDNVNIGANAIVVEDVPANCTVCSPKAQIVKLNGEKVGPIDLRDYNSGLYQPGAKK